MLRTLQIFGFLLLSIISIGQDCIEYPDIDGAICNGCTPSGWDGLNGAEEIEDPSLLLGTCNLNSVSPNGGNVAGFQVTSPSELEGMTTQIHGLVPGQEYALGFWWISYDCIDQAELSLTVDGVEYIFPPGPEWELAEVCVVATSTVMDLIVTATYAGSLSYIMVDDAYCNEMSIGCCTLMVYSDETSYEVCPNEDLQVDMTVDGIIGTAFYEWISDPADGVNFLDDTTVEDPIFNFPSSDENFSGTQYTFTLIATDDECVREEEIVINVLPHPSVSFDFEIIDFCTSDEEFELPIVSNEGISGTWDIPIFFLQDHPGETLTATFTPDATSVDCPFPSEHSLFVNELVTPTFDFDTEFCSASNDPINFDDTSIEGIEGSWTPSFIIPSEWSPGLISVSFNSSDPFCVENVIVEIELLESESLSFDLPSELCASTIPFVFPLMSLEGVSGNWEVPSFIPADNQGIFENTFISVGGGCFAHVVASVNVIQELDPNFDIPESICAFDNTFTLPPISLEFYEGSWEPASMNPALYINDVFTSSWTPSAGQSTCLGPQTVSIFVEEAGVPLFSIPDIFCATDQPLQLPAQSTNGIIGTWTVPIVDPSIGVDMIQSTFIPDTNFCAEEYDYSALIASANVPTFNFETEFCVSDPTFVFPSQSDNGINGTWVLAQLDPMLNGVGSFENVFIPTDDCAETVNIDIFVENETVPIFSLPDHLCWDDGILILPTISENNIPGTWNQSAVDPSIFNGVASLNFEPNDLDCQQFFSIEIEIIPEIQLMVNVQDPSSCELEDGSISFTGSFLDLEFSQDAGLFWSTQSSYNMLGPGVYEIDVRSSIFPDCMRTYEVVLSSSEAPTLNTIDVTQLSSCLTDDGEIRIDAEGDNLEYSIDGGLNFQSSPNFIGLPSGQFQIVVRSQDDPDCDVAGVAEILAFPLTNILNIDFNNPSDCNVEDGTIEIIAEGLELEYSIDGGITWSENAYYENLASEQYEIVVRSKINETCLDEEFVVLVAPYFVTIGNIVSTPPDNCNPNGGSMIITASSTTDLEYSIDGGVTWQTSNVFTDLSEGDYQIRIRPILAPNCVLEDELPLILAAGGLETPEFILNELTECDGNDASINLELSPMQVEYSIDNGISWQAGNTFDALSAGVYEIIIRLVDSPACFGILEFTVLDFPCPCNILSTNLVASDNDCGDIISGSVELEYINGLPSQNYDLSWSVGGSDESISGLPGGWYYLTISYEDNCEWIDSAFVMDYDPISFSTESTFSDCESSSNGVIVIKNVEGGAGEYTYSINGIDFQEEASFENLPPAEYELSVIDENNCVKTETIVIEALESADLELISELKLTIGETALLEPIVNVAVIDSFVWSPTEFILNPNELIAEINPGQAIEYSLTVYFGDCSETRTILVNVVGPTDIYIPNVFTPDNDGDNDVFSVLASPDADIKILTLNIYDRWGNAVYESDGMEFSWDGRLNGQYVEQGVYAFLLEFEKGGDELVFEAGTVTVLR